MLMVAIAWIYVVSMMAVAEATSSNGSVFGALLTFVLYGVLPLAIVLYLMATPARRRALRRAEASAANTNDTGTSDASAHAAPGAGVEPHGGRHPAGDAVAPERKIP